MVPSGSRLIAEQPQTVDAVGIEFEGGLQSGSPVGDRGAGYL